MARRLQLSDGTQTKGNNGAQTSSFRTKSNWNEREIMACECPNKNQKRNVGLWGPDKRSSDRFKEKYENNITVAHKISRYFSFKAYCLGMLLSILSVFIKSQTEIARCEHTKQHACLCFISRYISVYDLMNPVLRLHPAVRAGTSISLL